MADPDFLERPSAGGRYDPTAIDATGATLGDVLTAVSDGSGGKRAGYAAPSSGAVSSVFGRTGSVVATTGDYTIAQIAGLASVAANTILAGPTSGGSAAAAMRALVAADIPSLDAAKITTGVFPIARLATGTPDGTKFVRDDGTLATPSSGTGSAELAPAGPKTVIVTADWSTRNAGSATYTTSSRDSSVNIRVPASASNAFRGQDKAAPSTPYTCIATIHSPMVALDNMGYGVYFYNVAAAKAIAIQIVIVSSSLAIYLQLSDTSFGMTGTVYKSSTLGKMPLLLGLRDDGTNKSYWVGEDEEHLVQFYTHGRTVDITPDRVGFMGNPRQTQYDQVVTCFSWKEQSGSPA